MFLVKQHYAQRYFNLVSDINTTNYGGFTKAIQLNDSNYFACGTSISSSNFYYNYYAAKFDNKGNKLKEVYYEIPYKEISLADALAINDSVIYVCGTYIESTTGGTRYNRDVFLAKTVNGDTVWTKHYGMTVGTTSNSDQETAYEIIKTKDGTFALVGFTGYNSGYTQIYLLKVDLDGNLLWQQTYGGGNTDVAYSIVETPDKGFMMAGYTYSFGAGDRDGYVIKTDSLGNFQWQQFFGGGGNDGFVGITKIFDKQFLLCGWLNENVSITQQNKLWYVKIDSVGNLKDDKRYGGEKVRGVFKGAIENTDSSMVFFGSIKDSIGLPNSGLVMKVKANGDSLWAREYKRSSTQDDYFYGFNSTNDGGFIIAGSVSSQGSPSGTQDGWLLKVDCLGADSITQYLGNSCYAGNSTGVYELNNDYSSVVLGNNYPNPYSNSTTIPYYLNESDKNAELYVTDITGKELYKYQLQKDKNAIDIDMSALQSGFYFYSLYINHKLISTKKMVLSK